MAERLILVFDTCGPVLGVAVLGETFSQRTERIRRGGEKLLVPWAQELLGSREVAAVGVAVGPGAFTGLRVGIATAQGFAHATGAPLYGFSSLRTRGEQAGADHAWLDARKARVYAGRADAGWVPSDIAPESIVGEGLYTGEGALVYRTLIEAAGGRVADDADDPGLRSLAGLTRAALEANLPGDPTQVLPVYVREPDAVPPRTGVR